MTSRRRVAARIAVALSVGIVAAISAVAPSASAAGQNVQGNAGLHCYAVVKKLAPGQSESEVVEQGCVPAGQTIPPLRARTNGKASRPDTANCCGPYVLVSIYGEAGFGCGFGEYCYDLIGYDGPCDSAGYSFPNLGHPSFAWLATTASSWKVDSNCYWVQGFRERDYQYPAGWQAGNESYIGDYLNDHLFSLKVTA